MIYLDPNVEIVEKDLSGLIDNILNGENEMKKVYKIDYCWDHFDIEESRVFFSKEVAMKYAEEQYYSKDNFYGTESPLESVIDIVEIDLLED